MQVDREGVGVFRMEVPHRVKDRGPVRTGLVERRVKDIKKSISMYIVRNESVGLA